MKLIRTFPFVAVVAAAAACSSSSGTVLNALPDAAVVTPGPTPAKTATVTTQADLRASMRQLWEDHVFWTRLYIIDATAGLPGPEAAVSGQRLMQNQIDIGNAIKPFYGQDAGDQLTTLLEAHIQGAVTLLQAAMSGDQVALKKANTAWYANGRQIAQFLATANPNLPLATMITHMNRHLDLTLAEAQARLAGNWSEDVKAYDAVVDHIVTLADFLTQGIVAQFPAKIARPVISQKDEDLHVTMRKLWEDHVQWTRIWLVDQTAGLPETQFTTDRLLQNQIDIGDAAATFYGKDAGNQLTQLLQAHITGAVALVEAVEGGNPTDIANAKTAWYANADAIAHFLAAANPKWRLEDLQFHMKLHLDQTVTEATAHLNGEWSADQAAYDQVAAHILVMADILSDGIAAQFPALL